SSISGSTVVEQRNGFSTAFEFHTRSEAFRFALGALSTITRYIDFARDAMNDSFVSRAGELGHISRKLPNARRSMNKPNHLLRLFVLPLLRLWQRAPILGRFAAHFKIAIRFESNFADGALGRALVAIVSSHYTHRKRPVCCKNDP